MTALADYVTAGQAALEAANWLAAKQHFEAALLEENLPEAHDGLGIALWWLNQIGASHEHRTSAFIGFKQRGDLRRAGFVAAWLAREQVFLYGNSSAMKGWFAHAERLLNGVAPCAEWGWFVIMYASMQGTPDHLLAAANEAIEIARAFRDTALELMALALKGQALVGLGRIADGMLCLDEAMVMSTSGEVRNFMAISEAFCLTLSACEMAGDLVRCEDWCQMAAQFAERHQCAFLSAFCRTTYGSLQIASGRWQDAETTLADAIRIFDSGHRGLRWQAVLKLAELRVCQGRLEEAEVLLTGFEDQAAAIVPFARLYLAKGEYQQARVLLEQAMAAMSCLRPDGVPVLMLFVELSLAQNDLESAWQTVAKLVQLAETTQSDILFAQAELAQGQIKQHTSSAEAVSSFQAALARLQTQDSSLLAGRTRFEMAQALLETDRAGAIMWAKAALATFERIGAKHEANRAASLLRQLGSAVRAAPRAQGVLTGRESEVMALLANGLTNRDIAERLVISPKTVEHHVSQILSKLGLHSRAEAAAYAGKTPGEISSMGHPQ